LLVGVTGVIALYISVASVCVHVLGAEGLAQSGAPATAVMRIAFGDAGARAIAVGIAISTLGFLAQGMLTAPRVYYAMAEDGLFFRSVGWVHPKTSVPVIAIVLQGIVAAVIAVSGRYEQILNYVVSVDFIWFGLTGGALLILRRRAPGVTGYRVPGHPWTTVFFVAACAWVVTNTVWQYPGNSAIGLGIIAAGGLVYFIWRRGR
jgi:APA family basic amino acid/polyamine antiporter